MAAHWHCWMPTLARCPASVKFAVFEIGMNHSGEIEPLVKMVRPHLAIITTVEPVHLEFFSGIEAIADAKAEIFSGLVQGGAALLNRDAREFERLERAATASNQPKGDLAIPGLLFPKSASERLVPSIFPLEDIWTVAPFFPHCPVMAARIMKARMVCTAFACWASPRLAKIVARSARAYSSATCLIWSAGMSVMEAAHSGV